MSFDFSWISKIVSSPSLLKEIASRQSQGEAAEVSLPCYAGKKGKQQENYGRHPERNGNRYRKNKNPQLRNHYG